ncbi:hypothetical protein NPIL_138441 [Nephila pilipes]|uniref:Uncharacterized protein n=1 Tax=Nephila pilipes TaxID=299642 RepID=A0A8X6QD83_NEPPI|nr:hypothetical protein NPIL_138441 [Nephila pilipes]
MDNYKVVIEFNLNVLPNIPESCSGKNFNFEGNLEFIGNICINGDKFNMKINKLVKEEQFDLNEEYEFCEMDFGMDNEISLDSEIKNTNYNNENKSMENTNSDYENKSMENTNIDNENKSMENTNSDNENKSMEITDSDDESKSMENTDSDDENKSIEDNNGDDENKNINGDDEDKSINFNEEKNDLNMEIGNKDLQMEIKPMDVIPGVICMSFEKRLPYEYTISTTTHYVYEKCEGNWLEKLEEIIEALGITHFYAIGKNQQKYFQDYLNNITVELWNKPAYFNPKCSKCYRYGCSQYKTKYVLYDMFQYLFELQCEHK